jgi:hypothetical protein
MVCVGLPPLHSEAIGLDGYALSSATEIASPTDNRQINLLSRTPESRGTPDGRPTSTTPSIPHCDFEVSPVDHPPVCLFTPPKSVRIRNDQLDPSPLSFTIDIASPPPRQA